MTRTWLMILTMLILPLSACLDDIQETPLIVEDENLRPPLSLRATAGDGSVTLSWSAAPEAARYRLYRMPGEGGPWARVVETAEISHTDTDVSNGRQYSYAVSSVGVSGVESARSTPVTAMPTVYGLIINGGSAYTNSRSVTLVLTAPASTALMRIGNEPDLSAAAWRSYASSLEWELVAGDGIKTVYATFQDAAGTLAPTVSGEIELDTYARIREISILPQPHVYTPGSEAHFTVRVENDEPGGEAFIGIERLAGETVRLNDDGRGGDAVAGDGVYEASYRFPSHLRGTDLVVSGSFIDRAGNESPIFEAQDRIDFTDPPQAVRLIGAIDSTTRMITIRWEESTETHFAAYRIYRGTAPGVSDAPALFIRGLDNRGQTSYPDTDVREAETYYYRIFVVNDMEETAGSNEIAASTVDAYPEPVVLDDPSAIGPDRLTLTWSRNEDTDFAHYRVYRALSPGVTEDSSLIVTLTEQEMTWFDDIGIDTVGNSYYYRVFVYDMGGKYTRSNEVASSP